MSKIEETVYEILKGVNGVRIRNLYTANNGLIASVGKNEIQLSFNGWIDNVCGEMIIVDDDCFKFVFIIHKGNESLSVEATFHKDPTKSISINFGNFKRIVTDTRAHKLLLDKANRIEQLLMKHIEDIFCSGYDDIYY
mgnify:CR=1 FL=1